MSDFKTAHLLSMENEGGYVNHKNDRGGETIFGVARNLHPDWKGWSIVDSKKMFIDLTLEEGSKKWCNELTSLCKADSALMKLKDEFYKKEFWDKCRLDEISSQAICNAIYDASINHGVSRAAKLAQTTLGINADGIIGKQSIGAINSANETRFLSGYAHQRKLFMRKIVERDPSQSVFLNGWLARADRYAKA